MTRAKKILFFMLTSVFIFAVPLTVSARGHGGGHPRGNAGENCWNSERCLAGQGNQTRQQPAQPQTSAPAADKQEEQATDTVQPQQRIRQRDQQCEDPAKREDCPYRPYCNNQNKNSGTSHRHNWGRNPGCRLAPAAS